jgi:hypothetical protein
MIDDIQERDDNVMESGNCAANSCATICAASERPGIRGIEIGVDSSMSESSTRGILRRRELLGFSIRVIDGGVVIVGAAADLGVAGLVVKVSNKSNRRFRGGA